MTVHGARSCRLGGIPPGTVRVRAEELRTQEEDGLVQPAPSPLEIAEGDVRTLAFVLRRGLYVSVRPTKYGSALNDAEVLL